MPDAANAPVTVEIAAASVADALAASRGGAHRIELCQSLGEGGLTPSPGLYEAVREAVGLPVFVMIRPRSGDFLYDDGERDVMRRDLRHLHRAGADGFVLGALDRDGHVDEPLVRELVALAEGRPVTFHRAFDLCADPDGAIDTLCALGVRRLLTSGQAPAAPQGHAGIRRAVQRANGRLAVMAGAGVRAENVTALVQATAVREVHLSASVPRASGMAFRRPGVPMAATRPADEYARQATDADEVARVVAALARMAVP